MAHTKESDAAAPYPHGPYLYYTRTVKGKSYTLHCRRLADPADASEEVVLDVNQVAEGHSFCHVPAVMPSPDHTMIAYGTDFHGHEKYTFVVKELASGEYVNPVEMEVAAPKLVPDQLCRPFLCRLLKDRLTMMPSRCVWGKDNKSLYYAMLDKEQRPFQIWRHVLGTAQVHVHKQHVAYQGTHTIVLFERQSEDQLLHHEPDALYWLALSKSKV